MQKNKITSWNYDDQLVRSLIHNGEPWFVGKDIASSLGYKDTVNALKEHVDNEDKDIIKIMTTSGIQNAVVINESGLYSLIFGSKLETARQFKRWVTSEVLPAIRKTGSYTKPTNEAERAQRYLHQTNANTKGLHAESGIIGQQIRLLDRVERLADRGLIKKESFLSVVEAFNARARTLEPLVNIREKEIEENAKIMAFVSERLYVTGSDTDYLDADMLYVLYMDNTDGELVKSLTFKTRMEALFPNVRYAMKEDHGILEQVVYGIRLKTAGKNKSLPDTTLEG
jgi:prophage antirepressor-like protein